MQTGRHRRQNVQEELKTLITSKVTWSCKLLGIELGSLKMFERAKLYFRQSIIGFRMASLSIRKFVLEMRQRFSRKGRLNAILETFYHFVNCEIWKYFIQSQQHQQTQWEFADKTLSSVDMK